MVLLGFTDNLSFFLSELATGFEDVNFSELFLSALLLDKFEVTLVFSGFFSSVFFVGKIFSFRELDSSFFLASSTFLDTSVSD